MSGYVRGKRSGSLPAGGDKELGFTPHPAKPKQIRLTKINIMIFMIEILVYYCITVKKNVYLYDTKFLSEFFRVS